jgi:tyrosinase
MATYTRRNVYDLGGDWGDTILWYARGVGAMRKRKLADPLSWGFYGAIHGFDRALWQVLGYLPRGTRLPSKALMDRFWKQCQHGSWYFLPWHRGYLLAYEATLRAEIVNLKGPKDWALPYWNYFGGDGENQLPPAFASPDWPDGKGDNPLFVPQRYGPNNDGNVYIPLDQLNLDALGVPEYTGVASGGDPGFGGVDTGFEHGGPVHGDLESQPHDLVHVFVGGANPRNRRLPGLMSDPDTAGLDPIFYLHHANVDRLWEAWIQEPASEGNPTDPNWVNGPASAGERVFSMPMPPAGKPWDYTPGDMADLARLDYTYDDLSSPVAPAAAPAERLQRLGVAADIATEGVGEMARGRNVELMGSSVQQDMPISGTEHVSTSVHLDTETRQKVAASLQSVAADVAPPAEPDRVFLNLENVRGLNDATSIKVYINLPQGANPAEHPDNLAGMVALFGVRKATESEGEHGGQGLTFVLEITKLIDRLHLNDALDVNKLDVRIVPVWPVPEEANVRIGRISVFRQGS